MDLNSTQVQIRPRNPWEGIDLGFAMARRWFFPLWLLWWAGALPLYLLLQLIPFGDQDWLLLTLIWWAKPLYEPPLLYWLSRAAFNERLPLKAVLREWRHIVRPRLLMNLTLARFNGPRSFRMPVALLEGLRGEERRKRLRTLERRQSAGVWLTIVAVHFELALQLSLFSLLMLLIPEELRWFETEAMLFTLDPVIEWMQGILYLLAMSLIAPFYVAGGFALYLTRRTELEAWDIELDFRRIADRLRRSREPRGTGASTALLLLLLCGTGWLAPAPVQALTDDAPLATEIEEAATADRAQPRLQPVAPEEARQLIKEILAADEFGRHEQVGYWKYIGEEAKNEGEESNPLLRRLGELLAEIFSALANVGEFILWLAAGILAGYLVHWIIRNRGWLAGLAPRSSRPSATPVQICGLDIRPESLPEDIAGEALRRFRDGDPRAALSLLYRGALARFVHRDQLPIPNGATEGECLRLVEQQRPLAEKELFAHLTGLWLHLAYGHEPPASHQVEGVCARWREVFADGDRG